MPLDKETKKFKADGAEPHSRVNQYQPMGLTGLEC